MATGTADLNPRFHGNFHVAWGVEVGMPNVIAVLSIPTKPHRLSPLGVSAFMFTDNYNAIML